MSVDSKRDCISPRRSGRSALFLLTIVTACAGETATEPWDGVGVLGEYLVYEGFVRRYQMHLPQDYDPGRRAPLLILFHGAGDTGPWFQGWTGLDAIADEAGFITVWPNGTPAGACIDDIPGEVCDPDPPYYWLPEDIGFTRELVAHLRDGLAIDSKRIFAAGMSMGGLFTYDVACQMDDLFAAAATVAALPRPVTANSCDPSRPMPILITHGTQDGLFDWEGVNGYLPMEDNLAMWTEINGCTGDPAIEWLPDIADEGTRAWTETYDNCDGSAEVRLLGIDGGGHIWPGLQFSPSSGLSNLDVSVNEEMIEFFSRHSK
jgi:polyhydroxybutyrate depolymerase